MSHTHENSGERLGRECPPAAFLHSTVRWVLNGPLTTAVKAHSALKTNKMTPTAGAGILIINTTVVVDIIKLVIFIGKRSSSKYI